MKNYGTILSEMLKENHLKQRELSARTGISYSSIQRYIHGERTPKLEDIRKINEAIYWWGDKR